MRRFNKFFVLSLLCLKFSLVPAIEAKKFTAPTKKLSSTDLNLIFKNNTKAAQNFVINQSFSVKNNNIRIFPFAEYEKAGHLIFSAESDFYSAEIKVSFIKNLPQGVNAVIYTDAKSNDEQEALYRFYSSFTAYKDQIKIIKIPNSANGFWSRDAIPVPVWKENNTVSTISNAQLTVVDARYYHYFEPDDLIADYYQAQVVKHNFYFEGGNFMANSLGDCLVINTQETQAVPNQVFTTMYGCSRLLRLPYVKGIGHADESVKFVTNNHVLTDAPEYRVLLEKEGFKVTMLPRPNRDMETYVNSLIINGTVWLPVFRQQNDKQAIKVYEDLGLKVIALDSSPLSNMGAGSIHCITMTYPESVDFNQLLKHFSAKDVTKVSGVASGVKKYIKKLEDELKENNEFLKDPNLDRFLDSNYDN